MALSHSIAAPQGTVATHWRIHTITMHFDGPSIIATVTLNGYLDKAAKDAGATALDTRTLRKTLGSENVRTALYNAIKNDDEFSGATDDTD
jgi:hypothetical protein|tara:strand:+ start:698 stop:970 length:273 start_codon:yes stop_codon:yes gene_type:complete